VSCERQLQTTKVHSPVSSGRRSSIPIGLNNYCFWNRGSGTTAPDYTGARPRYRMTKFMTGVYRVSNPGSRITAQEILDNTAKEVGTELANDPELQAQMMDVMGTLYYGLGLYPQAESLLSRALGIRRAVLGPEHLQTVQLMHSLANALTKEGCPKAEKLYRETLAIRLRINGPDHPDTLNSLDTLGDTLDYEDRYSEAEQLERESLNIQRRDLGPEHPDTLKEASRRQKNFLRGLESS